MTLEHPNLTFEITIYGGKAAFYGSYSNPNPNAILCNHFAADITSPISVDYPNKDQQKEGFNNLYYCCLVGEETFQFSIEATELPTD